MKFLRNCETRLALDYEDSALFALPDRPCRRGLECRVGLADRVGARADRFSAKRFCTEILRVPPARSFFLGLLCRSPARAEHRPELAGLGALGINLDRKRLLETVRLPPTQDGSSRVLDGPGPLSALHLPVHRTESLAATG